MRGHVMRNHRAVRLAASPRQKDQILQLQVEKGKRTAVESVTRMRVADTLMALEGEILLFVARSLM